VVAWWPVPCVDVASRVSEEGPHDLAVAGVRRGEDVVGQEDERLPGRERLGAFLLQNILLLVHARATIAIAVVIVLLRHGVARVARSSLKRSEKRYLPWELAVFGVHGGAGELAPQLASRRQRGCPSRQRVQLAVSDANYQRPERWRTEIAQAISGFGSLLPAER
jgi:hypothetical protein